MGDRMDAEEESCEPLMSIASSNATASLPLPEEAALQEIWLRIFDMTSTAPLASCVTLPSNTARSRSPPSPCGHRIPTTPGRVNAPPTPAPSQTRKRQEKQNHWRLTPLQIHRGIYEAMRCHSADWWVSYYLRANNMDVDSAMNDLLQHVHWRQRIAKVDSELLIWGESGALRTIQDPKAEATEKRVSEGFLSVMQNYETRFLKGQDCLGRIITFVKVKNHKMGVYPTESYERFIPWHVETARMMMPETRGDGILLFDLEGYSLNNMDYRPLKIIIKIMKDYYPQGLGDVIIHRAPALFTSVWALIKNVVSEGYYSHIHFTKNRSELQQFVPFETIPKDLDGGEKIEYRYVLPDLDDPANGGGGESLQLKRDHDRTVLEEQRMEIARLFEETTKEWIDASRKGRESRGLKALREKYQRELLANYWHLDEYIRSRTIYDQLGWIQPPDWVDG